MGHKLGNFVCLCNLSKTVLNKCKNIGSQWMCRTDFDIDIVGSNPWVNTCSNTLKDSLEKEWCISLKWVFPSTKYIFKVVEHPIEVGHVLAYFYVKYEPSCTCNALFTMQFLKWRTHGTCKHVKYVLHNCTSFFWMHNVIFFQDNKPYFGNNTLWCRQLPSWKIF